MATITLNRPAKKNAFTFEMLDEWAQHLHFCQAADDVRVVVMTGSGGSFCAGVDFDSLDATERSPLQEKRQLQERVHQVALALEAIDKPVIAAVAGPAVGAGMDMALLCDLRIAAKSARFSEGYVRVGLVPGDGGTWLLPRIVGRSTALKLLWTGDFVDAEEALRIGLVEQICEDDDLASVTNDLARKLAGQSPIVVRLVKRAVRQGETHDLRTSLDLISSHMAVVTSTRDYVEARAAFRDRRPANFEGN
ncbi:enoyl-CoA hydratase/isomerase family protein [Mycolicibacterium sp. P9-22]|uniref:enoyl-CoA hydratase/isomerase family protein n=1 Tax=Mycolicibacterium sp. P9-22 TaxID=2024613 RepID=UPI00351AB989